MRRPVEPSEPVEPAEHLSRVIKGRLAHGLTLNSEPDFIFLLKKSRLHAIL